MLKDQESTAFEFEDRLGDLVYEYMNRGLDLQTIASALEIQLYAVNEAPNEEE